MGRAFKKLKSILLSTALFTTIGGLPVGLAASAENANRPIKVLAIGNSYSNNATQYISKIAKSMGLEISASSLYYAGCRLDRHVLHYETYEKLGHDAYYAESNPDKYSYLVIDGENNYDVLSIQEAIAYTDWDYITLQQMPGGCDDITYYYTEENPYLTKLYDYVKTELAKNNNTKCEILMHQGWSFSHAMSIDNAYIYYPVDYENTRDFFEKIESTVEQAADILKNHAKLDTAPTIIPSGKAVQLAKDQFGFADSYEEPKSLYTDYISHLSDIARYLVGCVWVEVIAQKAGLSETDVRNSTFIPQIDGMGRDMVTTLRSCAHEAVTGEADTVYGDWRAVPEGSGLKITYYMGEAPKDGKIILPSEIEEKEIWSVEEKAFKFTKGVTEILKEEDVTE